MQCQTHILAVIDEKVAEFILSTLDQKNRNNINFLQATKFCFYFVSRKLVHLMQRKSEVSSPQQVIKILKGRGNKVKINSNKNPWYRVST